MQQIHRRYLPSLYFAPFAALDGRSFFLLNAAALNIIIIQDDDYFAKDKKWKKSFSTIASEADARKRESFFREAISKFTVMTSALIRLTRKRLPRYLPKRPTFMKRKAKWSSTSIAKRTVPAKKIFWQYSSVVQILCALLYSAAVPGLSLVSTKEPIKIC